MNVKPGLSLCGRGIGRACSRTGCWWGY